LELIPVIIAIIVSLVSTAFGLLGFISTRDSRIDSKVDSKIRDCIPGALSERLASIETSLGYIQRDISEIKESMKHKT
jgi:hypothetical protein